MIKVSDNKHTNFPVECGEDYEQFFQNELMYYLYSDIWKKKILRFMPGYEDESVAGRY